MFFHKREMLIFMLILTDIFSLLFQFYCIIAVSLFSVLALFTYFPVLEFIYVVTCALFFYPSMYHYGIVDRIHARIDRLTQPILRHWENNRTKRTRKILRPSKIIFTFEAALHDFLFHFHFIFIHLHRVRSKKKMNTKNLPSEYAK